MKKFPALRFEGTQKREEITQEWQRLVMTPYRLQTQLLGDPNSYVPLKKSLSRPPKTEVKRP